MTQDSIVNSIPPVQIITDTITSIIDNGCMTLNEMFGQAAVKTPCIADSSAVFTSKIPLWYGVVEYMFYLLIFGYIIIIAFKYSEYIGRVLRGGYSIGVLERMIKSSNFNIKTLSFLLMLLIPLFGFIFYINHIKLMELYQPKAMLGVTVKSLGVCVGVVIYSSIVQSLFLMSINSRRALKRIFFGEQIFFAASALTLCPFIFFGSIKNTLIEGINIALYIVILMLIIRYIIIVFRLFFTENISYVRLILYLCISKGVIIALMVMFMFGKL